MWFFAALSAAVLWGFDYAFAERVLKHISVPVFLSIQLFIASLILMVVAWATGNWHKDMSTLLSSPRVSWLLVAGIIAFSVANVLICVAIQDKNATFSSLIEISYPLFIALISWLIFGEGELTWSTGIGGLLIFSGVSIIYFFNR
jgi:drug/metabolite transporter (DMT)-like permease